MDRRLAYFAIVTFFAAGMCIEKAMDGGAAALAGLGLILITLGSILFWRGFGIRPWLRR